MVACVVVLLVEEEAAVPGSLRFRPALVEVRDAVVEVLAVVLGRFVVVATAFADSLTRGLGGRTTRAVDAGAVVTAGPPETKGVASGEAPTVEVVAVLPAPALLLVVTSAPACTCNGTVCRVPLACPSVLLVDAAPSSIRFNTTALDPVATGVGVVVVPDCCCCDRDETSVSLSFRTLD